MQRTSVFDLLRLGITFDRNKYGKDIEVFEKSLEYTMAMGREDDEDNENHELKEPSFGDDEKEGAVVRHQTREGDDVQTNDPFERANVLRKRNKIRVSGSAPPVPLTGFDELSNLPGYSKRLDTNLELGGFQDPTAVQKQSIPALAAGRELMVVAPTGSGKTLAFLIPTILRVREQKAKEPDVHGIRALVLSPTKELSMQSGRVLIPLLPGLRVRCSVLSKATAAGTDFSKVDILLANPLRLDSLAKEGKIDLSHVETLILDEADKLFEMGFSDQIDSCLAACTHSNIVRCLFSATLPENVEMLARSVLKDPLRITVGERNTSASSVEQQLLFVGRENGKLLAIRQLLLEGLRPPVLIFVNTKEKAKEVHSQLMFEGVHVDSLHAAQSQAARVAAVEKFREGKTWVLIATDLVARGLDFAGVETVINLDFPNSTVDYIHRVGRTGRAGRQGKAITFFTEDDVSKLRGVANVIRAAGGEVEPWMLQLKKQRNRKRKKEDRDGLGQLRIDDEEVEVDKQNNASETKIKAMKKRKKVSTTVSRATVASRKMTSRGP